MLQMITGAKKTPEMRITAAEIGLALDPSSARNGKQTAVRLIWIRQITPIGAAFTLSRLHWFIAALSPCKYRCFICQKAGHPLSGESLFSDYHRQRMRGDGIQMRNTGDGRRKTRGA